MITAKNLYAFVFLRSDPRGMRLASLLDCRADARCLCMSGAMRFDNFVHNAHTNS